MSLKKYIAFLTEEDGRSRQIVNDIVTSLNAPKQLPEMPDGNQDISIGWERSLVDHGTVVNFGLSLGFVMTGRKILANDFYKFNSDRKLYLLLKRLTYEWTDTTYKEYYKQYYKGLLDFSQASDKKGESRFEIPIMSSNLQKMIKANEGTKYDIPLDIDAKNLTVDGMLITGVFTWLITEYIEGATGTLPSMFLTTKESSLPGIYVSDILGGFALGYASITEANTEYFLACTLAPFNNTVNVSGTIQIKDPLPGFPADIYIWVYNTIADTLVQIPLYTGDEAAIITIDTDVPLNEGDRFFLQIVEYRYESNLTFKLSSKQPTSVIQGFTLLDLGRKLVEKMTGNADNFESVFLESSSILITSFDGVRGLPGASIKTSWADYKKAVNAYLMTSVQITDKVRINSRASAYVPDSVTPAIELGEIKKFECNAAPDLLYTSVRVGHAEQQTDDVNGKYGFNGWHVYSSPIKSVPSKELDLTSPWKADPYEIEQTRANYEGKTTTDNSTDNDIVAIAAKPDPAGNSFDSTTTFQADGAPFAPGEPFANIVAPTPLLKAGMRIRVTNTVSNNQDLTIKFATTWFFGQLVTFNEPVVNEASVVAHIEILEGQYYTLDRDIPVTQLTVPDVDTAIKATIYNIPLTPKRLFMVHAPWLAGISYGYAPGVWKFENTNRNKELISGGLVEKADVPVSALGDPLFIPKYFEYETLVPSDMSEIMEANPTPTFAFTEDGNRYTGFFILGGIAATTLEEQVFKLLVSPENQMENLI